MKFEQEKRNERWSKTYRAEKERKPQGGQAKVGKRGEVKKGRK